MKLKSYISLLLFLGAMSAHAQEPAAEEGKDKKAWEIGLGGTVFQFNRVGFSNFSQLDDGYAFDLSLNHAVWGGGLYAARELDKHFYLDFQGNVGMTNKSINGKHKFLVMAGLQFLAMMLPQWITKRRNRKLQKLSANPAADKNAKTMKWVNIIMLVVTIVMGFSLPAAMGVYWAIGALISMLQTAITQYFMGKKMAKQKKGI